MSDKPFDPVTEGTAQDFFEYQSMNAMRPLLDSFDPSTYRSTVDLIAARDAAKKAEGRREGLEEAAEICKSNRYRGAWQAIRAAKEEKDESND